MLTMIQQLCSKKQKQIHTNTNKSTHSEMSPVRQNPIQRTARTAHLSVLMTVHNFSTQYNTEQFWQSPLLPPDKHHSSDAVYWRRGLQGTYKMLPLYDGLYDGPLETSWYNSVLVYCDIGNWRHICDSAAASINPAHTTLYITARYARIHLNIYYTDFLPTTELYCDIFCLNI